MVLGLDLDGVVIDVSQLKRRLGKVRLMEGDLVSVSVEELPPVRGVDRVFELGIVKAILTRRRWCKPIREWFWYWFGGAVVPVYCLGQVPSKARKCWELGIRVFVDDDYCTVVDLEENGIRALWFDVEKDGDLYEFLVREGVIE
jgi:hypothetical protein